MSPWFWFGSSRSGLCSGTLLVLTLILLVWLCGVHASLSLGPGGEVPELNDLIFYSLSNEEFTSLLHNVVLLVCLGPCQERRWGTFSFLILSGLSAALLPAVYALFLFVTGDEASRICGYSGPLMALLAAQCRQVKRRRVLRCLPPWCVPWLLLLLDLFVLPSEPGLLHFYAICLGLNYSSEFIKFLQRIEGLGACACLPTWAFISGVSYPPIYQLPTYTSAVQRPEPRAGTAQSGLAATHRSQLEDHSHAHAWALGVPQSYYEPATATDTRLLDEELLRAGIMASLQDAPEGAADKAEVSKSSVSSIRLQQLQKMGFSIEKAVVALAATPNLDGAISLLIEDQVGDSTVVVSKGKKTPSPS